MKYSLTIIFIACLISNNPLANVIIDSNQLQLDSSNANETKAYPDSIDYWINTAYLTCIESGKPICNCLSNHSFLLLHLNEKEKTLLVQSSVFYFGLETFSEFSLIENGNSESNFVVNQIFPLSDSLVITIDENLEILYNGEKMVFEKRRLKTLNIPTTPKGIFSIDLDIWEQRNTLNAHSILRYPFTIETDTSTVFFTHSQFKKLITENRLSISCSDDFHHNCLTVDGEPNKYFHMHYGDGYVIIYDEKKGLNRGEKLDLSSLEKQVLFMKKPNR